MNDGVSSETNIRTGLYMEEGSTWLGSERGRVLVIEREGSTASIYEAALSIFQY